MSSPLDFAGAGHEAFLDAKVDKRPALRAFNKFKGFAGRLPRSAF